MFVVWYKPILLLKIIHNAAKNKSPLKILHYRMNGPECNHTYARKPDSVNELII